MGAAPRARVRAAPTAEQRDAAIDAWLRETATQDGARVVLVEGQLFDRDGPAGVPLVGLGAGCPCCTGLVVLRVTLGRTLRKMRPGHLLLLPARADHVSRLRHMLASGELGLRFEVDR
jgi:hypothetical protein